MSIVDLKMFEYYTLGRYRGFTLKETQILDNDVNLKRLVFTNGHFEVSAIGRFQEEALQMIFSQIDKYCEDIPVSPSAF